MLEASNWTEHRVPNGGTVEGSEGAEEVFSLIRGATVSTGQILRAPRDWTTSQRVYMEELRALATYVAEDDLVGHQLKEWPLVLWEFDAQCRGMPGQEDLVSENNY